MIREENETYRLHRSGGREFLTFRSLDRFDGLQHLFTTRHGGVSEGCCSSWNFGAHELDTEENILRNYEILAEIFGVTAERMVRSAQTHTANIRVVTEDDCGKGITGKRDYTDIDGLVTNVRGLPIITGHADCNAVFFYDPVRKVIGLAHSGWKGTLKGISGEMVQVMGDVYGCQAADLIAGIGPALCRDCFEIDEDVAELFFAADRENLQFAESRIRTDREKPVKKYYLDLKAMIRRDLIRCGVPASQISDMGLCTKCHKETFFSHRGHHGRRGIMAAAMMLRQV